MKRLIQRLLRSAGYDLTPYPTFRGQPIPDRPWEQNPAFLAAYENCLGLTLLDRRRLYTLYQSAVAAARLPGHFAECGVYRGGSAKLLARLKRPDQVIHLFDTVSGMPETDAQLDIHQAQDFSDTSLTSVRQVLAGLEGIDFRPGLFPSTTAGLEGTTFSLVHIDFDIYQSMADACTFFYPRLVRGGCIIIDDYGFPSCPGAKQAVDEFCANHHVSIHYLMTGQALLHNFHSTL
ncbi:hypothetical protein MASR2M8_15940 [Opitutaceae bacterium]